MNPTGEYSQRKALLIAKADLERLKLRYSLREIKHAIHPPADASPAKWVSPVANTLMVLALPALGTERISQILRMASTALLAYRFFNKWQQGQ
jgi:hypothetical protein